MRTSFHPRLINDPFSDPGLYVAFLFQRRALLFDLGDLHALSTRELLKVSHVFVTHAHMDHFFGFDALLRICLGRDMELHLFGPTGILGHVEGKLAGYTWNLVEDYEYPFRLRVTEISPEFLRTRKYLCNKRFQPEHDEEITPFHRILLQEPSFRIEAAILDHRIPCLGLCLVENFHVNIIKEELGALGLTPGPWLTRFKGALYDRRDPDELFEVPWESEGGVQRRKAFRLGDLAERISRITCGQKIGYVTDVTGSPENRKKILDLVKDTTHLFIEAAFLDCDRDMAGEKSHLTAKEAGELAGHAGAGRITLFHFSPRYTGRGEELEREALETFQNHSVQNGSIC